jgi:hypothetical protein
MRRKCSRLGDGRKARSTRGPRFIKRKCRSPATPCPISGKSRRCSSIYPSGEPRVAQPFYRPTGGFPVCPQQKRREPGGRQDLPHSLVQRIIAIDVHGSAPGTGAASLRLLARPLYRRMVASPKKLLLVTIRNFAIAILLATPAWGQLAWHAAPAQSKPARPWRVKP